MSIWRRSSEVAFSRGGDSVFVLQLGASGDGTPVELSGSAAMIWEHIDGVQSEEDIIDAIATLVGRTGNDVAPDVRPFLDELHARHLIER